MKVAVIGTGISGITLALRLQQLGVETTVWSERSPAERRAGPLENLVARFPATQDRERELGVDHWDDVAGAASLGIDVDVVGTPLGFHGRLERPARAVDFREYLSRLTDDYVERGGVLRVETLPATALELSTRTTGHDIVVVAAGRGAGLVRALFPVRSDRSPYAEPQRRLLGGVYRGVEPSDPPAVCFNIAPDAGEIFQQPFVTAHGIAAAILVEAVPGGPLDHLTRIDNATDVESAAAVLYRGIEEFAPRLAGRIDPQTFGLLGPLDVLSGAITPAVRRGRAQLPDGRVALAIGDAWVVNDPITGQGANIGSHCAWHMAAALTRCSRVDNSFAERLEDELWSFAGPVTGWTNAFLRPPPPHVLDVLAAATAHQSIADAFAQGFADPVRLASQLATPNAAAAFVHDNLQLLEV
jgi:2-polyprenyl-6-methoxyphenol hydroxylase-like FAD-dependent oxidoreductase